MLSSFLFDAFSWTLLTWTFLPWPFLPPLCGCVFLFKVFAMGHFFLLDIITMDIFFIYGHFFRGRFTEYH